MLTHAAVRQGVVSVYEGRPGDVRLVAYIVPAQGADITVTEVRKHLRGSLPEYMIPQHVVELGTLPMTPNGKIDRKALPSPLGGPVIDPAAYAAPVTAMEKMLAAIWKEKLNIDRVGLHDNFFDLGGHSLLSMQVIFQIKDQLNARVSPRDMLLNDLSQIAAKCDSMINAETEEAEEAEEPVKQTRGGLFGKIAAKIKAS